MRMSTIVAVTMLWFTCMICPSRIIGQVRFDLTPYGSAIDGGSPYSMCQLRNGALFALAGKDLWRTNDDGTSWTKVSTRGQVPSFPYDIRITKIDRGGKSILLYYAERPQLSDKNDRNLYYSTDEGATWLRSQMPVELDGAFEIEIVPAWDGSAIAVTKPSNGLGSPETGTGSYIYEIRDTDMTFRRIHTVSTKISSPGVRDSVIWFIASSMVKKFDTRTGLTDSINFGHGYVVQSLHVLPRICIRTPYTIYVENADGNFESTGSEFGSDSAFLVNNKIIICGSDSVVAFSQITDNEIEVRYLGKNDRFWRIADTIKNVSIAHTGIALMSGAWMISTMKSIGPFISKDLVTWTPCNKGMHDVLVMGFHIVNETECVAWGRDELYYRNGINSPWRHVPNDSRRLSSSNSDITATPSGTLIAAGHNGIERSTNNGATWQKPPIPDGFVSWPSMKGRICVTTDGTLYVAYNGLLKSTDDGQTWHKVIKVTRTLSQDVAADRNDNIYATNGKSVLILRGDSLQPIPEGGTTNGYIMTSASGEVIGAGFGSAGNVSRTRYLNGNAVVGNAGHRDNGEGKSDMVVLPGDDLLFVSWTGCSYLPASDTRMRNVELIDTFTVRSAKYHPSHGLMIGTSIGSIMRTGITVGVEDRHGHSVEPATVPVVVPNPASDVATIIVKPGVESVSIYDATGRRMEYATSTLNGTLCTIDCSLLNAGSYTILLDGNSLPQYLRFVVVR